MRKIKPFTSRIAATASLLLIVIQFACTSKENMESYSCKTCIAKNNYGNEIERKQVCTQQGENEFRAHYNQATTPVTVTCD